MIRRIQALNYRCLRYVDVALNGFQVLVGPNGSGKSALFDAIAFVFDADDLYGAMDLRTNNFQDLVWGRPKDHLSFEMALEFDIPDDAAEASRPKKRCHAYRYELFVEEMGGGFFGNDAFVCTSEKAHAPDQIVEHPESISQPAQDGAEVLGKDVSIGPGGSAGAYPFATKFMETNRSSVRKLFLDSDLLREASPPKHRRTPLEPDGSNFPWAVQRLQITDTVRYEAWVRHVRTVLRDLQSIRVVEREDDRHAYLMIRYANGVEIPSWAVSEGTLRLLALTLIAYLPDNCIYLVEEPENGIHPLAVEAVYQSLSSVYDSQVLVASHSPELLMCAEPKDVLCFSRDAEGATQVIRGDRHPRLAHWRSAADVDLLFASEIIG